MTDSTLQLLRNATNEELDQLVEYIKDAAISEWLTISDAYKKYAPDHSKYVDEIYDEIRKFGGNTFANFWRDLRDEPQRAYIDIVRDVADKFSVKNYKNMGLEELERALVNKVWQDAMKKATPDQRQEMEGVLKREGKGKMDVKGMLQSGNAVFSASYTVTLSSVLLGNVGRVSLLSFAPASVGMLNPVSAVAFGIGAASGPAFRVVVPCVLYIAYLRNKKADQSAVDSLKGAFDDD